MIREKFLLWGKALEEYRRTGSLRALFAYIYLALYYQSILRKKKVHFPLVFYYWLAGRNRATDLNSARILRLLERRRGRVGEAVVYAEQMYLISQGQPEALSRQDRYDIVHTAVYAGAAGFLEQLRADEAFFEGLPGLRHYAAGCLAHAQGQPGWESFFQQCAGEYRAASDRKAEEPKYVQFAANFFSYEQCRPVLEAVEPFNGDLKEPASEEPVILVSCERTYFSVYAPYYLRRLRRRNRYKVIFLIVTGQKEEETGLSKLTNDLCRYGNVDFRFLPTSYNLGLYSSLARFLQCEAVLTEEQAPVLITDIDLDPALDYGTILREAGQALTLIRHGRDMVPWALMNARLCFFRPQRETFNYLRIFSAYTTYALARGARWTLDQAALYQARVFYEKEYGALPFQGFSKDIAWQAFKKTPYRLSRLKDRHKTANIALAQLKD